MRDHMLPQAARSERPLEAKGLAFAIIALGRVGSGYGGAVTMTLIGIAKPDGQERSASGERSAEKDQRAKAREN
jgi:hypothetical protein